MGSDLPTVMLAWLGSQQKYILTQVDDADCYFMWILQRLNSFFF